MTLSVSQSPQSLQLYPLSQYKIPTESANPVQKLLELTQTACTEWYNIGLASHIDSHELGNIEQKTNDCKSKYIDVLNILVDRHDASSKENSNEEILLSVLKTLHNALKSRTVHRIPLASKVQQEISTLEEALLDKDSSYTTAPQQPTVADRIDPIAELQQQITRIKNEAALKADSHAKKLQSLTAKNNMLETNFKISKNEKMKLQTEVETLRKILEEKSSPPEHSSGQLSVRGEKMDSSSSTSSSTQKKVPGLELYKRNVKSAQKLKLTEGNMFNKVYASFCDMQPDWHAIGLGVNLHNSDLTAIDIRYRCINDKFREMLNKATQSKEIDVHSIFEAYAKIKATKIQGTREENKVKLYNQLYREYYPQLIDKRT